MIITPVGARMIIMYISIRALHKTTNYRSAGVAVGGGWQALVAYINLFCYYVVGLPLGFLLGYKTTLGVEVMNNYYFNDNNNYCYYY